VDAEVLLPKVYQIADGANETTEIVGQPIRLAGYLLPLERVSRQEPVSRFLLVPYVGACIHVPPPPPNQIVYLETPTAIQPPGLFTPVWAEGRLDTRLVPAPASALLYPRLTDSLVQTPPPTRKSPWGGCRCLTCGDRPGPEGWLLLAVEAVPCSGSLLVLLYGLANNLLGPAVLMVVAIAVGMALTLSGIGLTAIWGSRMAHRRLGLTGQRQQSFLQAVRVAGAGSIFLLGLLLFTTTLTSGGGR
jgi:hypothetical protein